MPGLFKHLLIDSNETFLKLLVIYYIRNIIEEVIYEIAKTMGSWVTNEVISGLRLEDYKNLWQEKLSKPVLRKI